MAQGGAGGHPFIWGGARSYLPSVQAIGLGGGGASASWQEEL